MFFAGSKDAQRRLLQKARCDKRRDEWTACITNEIDTIKSIGWYLQMMLLLTEQVHEHVTYTQLQRMPIFQEEISNHALLVYNNIFRHDDHRRFVILDTGNKELDGRIGTVLSYDTVRHGYQVLIDPKRKDKSEHETFLKTMNMQPIRQTRKLGNIKRDLTHIKVRHCFLRRQNGANDDTTCFQIKFDAQIFQKIRNEYKFPEQQSDAALHLMKRLLSAKAEFERVEQQQLSGQQAEFNYAYATMKVNRLTRYEQPTKRARIGRAMPTPSRVQQITSVLKSNFDHARNTMERNSSTDDEHLFTIPFLTEDKSLFESSAGLELLHFENKTDCLLDEQNLMKAMGGEEIIMTKKSIETLTPGIDIDQDVLDFCMKW